MSGGSRSIVYGECDPATQRPNLQWLRQRLAEAGGSNRVKLVIVTNPCNPTGGTFTPIYLLLEVFSGGIFLCHFLHAALSRLQEC